MCVHCKNSNHKIVDPEMEPIKQMQTVTEYQNVTVKLLRYSIKMFIDYSDFVYDLELEKNHILYVRRNGKCVWGSVVHYDSILLTEKEFAEKSKSTKGREAK